MASDALLLTPVQAAKRLNVARSFLYNHLLMSGSLASVKIGKCRRIPVSALEAYVARLLAEQGQEVPPTPAA
jgi:excisionase family DNA binding protein